jgi:subtilisin-like proprotein convertase family protein
MSAKAYWAIGDGVMTKPEKDLSLEPAADMAFSAALGDLAHGALVADSGLLVQTLAQVTAPPVTQWFMPTAMAGTTDGQWHLQAANPYDINVEAVWGQYTGHNVTVGVVDSGVQYSHHELSGNYNSSIDYDFLQGNADGSNKISADNHGTAVAGVIAAANNGVGSTGVAYNSIITSFRLISNVGISGQMVADAFTQDVDVSNNSWGFTQPFVANSLGATIDGAFQTAVSTNRDGLGTVFVMSSGNSRTEGANTNYSEMQNARFASIVAATDSDGTYSSFSTPGASVRVSAPGTQIYTTDVTGSGGYDAGSDYTTIQGTSFSAPIVSGVAALMLDANSSLGYRDVQDILAYSARNSHAASETWELNGSKLWNGGGMHASETYGYGLVDATAAVKLAESWNLIDKTAGLFSNEINQTYTSGALNQTFDNTTITSTINVGTGMRIEHAELRLSLTHGYIPDLVITLTSPDGTQSLMFDRPNASTTSTLNFDSSWSFLSTQHLGETGLGNWTLSIRDAAVGNAGTLQNWSLKLYGDTLTSDDTYVYTDEFGTMAFEEASRRTLTDASGNDTVNLSAITGNLNFSLVEGAANTLGSTTLTIANGSVIENVIGGWGNDTLTGNTGDNILIGGQGDDTLNGGIGNDTYRYGGSYSFDTDTIVDSSGSDTLDFSQLLTSGLFVTDL